MAGSKEGGQKAAQTNKLRHGSDFYHKIGSQGGKLGRDGGFASHMIGEDGLTGKERAIIAGSKGGKVSRRSTNPHAANQANLIK